MHVSNKTPLNSHKSDIMYDAYQSSLTKPMKKQQYFQYFWHSLEFMLCNSSFHPFWYEHIFLRNVLPNEILLCVFFYPAVKHSIHKIKYLQIFKSHNLSRLCICFFVNSKIFSCQIKKEWAKKIRMNIIHFINDTCLLKIWPFSSAVKKLNKCYPFYHRQDTKFIQ